MAATLLTLALRRLIPDDTIPMLRPPFGHAVVPLALGAVPELHTEKLWAPPLLPALGQYRTIALAVDGAGLRALEAYYRRLLAAAAGRFVLGLCEIPGPGDLGAYLRGLQTMLTDPYDEPELVRDFLAHAQEFCRAQGLGRR